MLPSVQPAPPWHALPADEVCARLSTSRRGLDSAEAARRLALHGPNELAPAEPLRWPAVLAAQFRSLLILILLAAAGISVFVGEWTESIAIVAIVLMSVGLGFAQEYRAERAIRALRQVAAPKASVLRDGAERVEPSRDLVPGDVISLHTGDRVAADARLLEAVNLTLDEAPLTGESTPVEKQTEPLPAAACAVADRSNLVHAGTSVTCGRGLAVVIATGLGTEFGRVAGLLREVEAVRTPLQVNLDRLGRAMAALAGAVVVLVTAAGLARGAPPFEMFLFGIALAVAVVPEALPAVVTISLALGVKRMSRRNALIRHLPAVETLGCTSVICSDKTGTLTRGEMTVRALFADGADWIVMGVGYEPAGEFQRQGRPVAPTPVLRELLRAAALASDARLERSAEGARIQGDPTEGALVVAAAKAGLLKEQLERECPRCGEIPFDSDRRTMTTLHRCPPGPRCFTKGAPEAILASCTQELTEHGTLPLDEEGRARLRQAAGRMADTALRVLAVARREGDALAQATTEMTFLGLVGMSDPPRAEARGAVATCRDAGVRPVMITGDHPDTARAVARELEMLKTGRVVTGLELEKMSDEELRSQVEGIDVYARVTPEHKLRVVEAWQQQGHVVAMTGDGVNDAPALKKADVGIAMGLTGTDVSREAAAMTLTDDCFASIVGAVEEGRGIFSNIRKYLMYLMSSNVGEIGLIAGATLLGLPMPLTAVQILYVNLATDGFPALALAIDPPDRDLMRRPPRDRRRGMFTRPVVFLIAVGGLWSMVVNLALFQWALASGHPVEHGMTMAFVSLVLIQLFKAYSFRSDRISALVRPFSNRWLNAAVAWELGLLSLVVYLPALQGAFGTHGLVASDLLVAALAASTVLPALELAKLAVRRADAAASPGHPLAER
jgi:Ca2+-transporting ATPase